MWMSAVKSVWLFLGRNLSHSLLETAGDVQTVKGSSKHVFFSLGIRWANEPSVSKHSPSLISAAPSMKLPQVTFTSSQHYMLWWCHLPPELANALSRHCLLFFSLLTNACTRTWHAVASQHIFCFSKMKRGSKGENGWRIFLISIPVKSKSSPVHLE